MADIVEGLSDGRYREIRKAVLRSRTLSRAGLSERLFALVFSGLVYPQIWEDPDVDMEAMQLAPGHRIVTIASGGCNVLAYLTRAPATIDAVDLNTAHVALNRLKLAAVKNMPSQADFSRFFSSPGHPHNSVAYDRFIAPHLDPASRTYWERRGPTGRRRIAAFDGNFHHNGLLGWFIAAGHLIARLHGVDPSGMTRARSLREQRRFFDAEIAPLFDKPLVRLLSRSKASLFGLGIPPAQYDELCAEGGSRDMSRILRQRMEKLACHFPIGDNYFAWQAFARRYPDAGQGTRPHALRPENFAKLQANAAAVTVHHRNFTELLSARRAGSVDRYVLLDAQDWMSDDQLNALWGEITRTADKDARVIFRTAGEPSILPGRLSQSLLDQWLYDQAESRRGTRLDRSAIYGGFHVYVKKPA